MTWLAPPTRRAAGAYPAAMDDQGRRVEMDAKRARFSWTLLVAVCLFGALLGLCLLTGACR